MKKTWNKIVKWIVDKIIHWKVYNWFLRDVAPFIRFTPYYAQPNNPDFIDWGPLVKRAYKILKPGHIILAIDEKNFAGKVIGKVTADKMGNDFDGDGEADVLTHAAFCVSKNDFDFEIAEMTHYNFTKSCLADVCFKSTRVMILECNDFDAKYVKKMVGLTKYFEHVKYDNQFEMGDQQDHDDADKFLENKFILGNEHLACSELVYEYDFERRLEVNLEPLLGVKPYISPMGLYNAANVKILWDSKKVRKDG
jgi:hypothetical protein